MSCPTCNRQEPASLAPTMSWRNTSYAYPSISLAQAQAVCSHCTFLLASLTSLVLAYPPRDPQVEQWFAASNNPTEQGTQDRCHAFLHALLFTTLSHLQEIYEDKAVFEKIQAKPSDRMRILASEFRSRMAKGRTFEAHGDYRTKFYDDVYVRAQQVVLPSSPSIQQSLPSEYEGHSSPQSAFHSTRQQPAFNYCTTQS